MTAKRTRKTAAELAAELANDPAYQERVRIRDEAIQQKAERLRIAERPLVEALQAAGAEVTSVWDLVNSKRRYPGLVPILIAQLGEDYPDEIRDGIARALAVREARPYWDELRSAYLKADGPVDGTGANQVKWALHLALAAAADETRVAELIRLAADRHHGAHRSMFIDALDRFDDPLARAAIEELAATRDPALKDAFQRLEKRRRRRLKS